MEDENIEIGKPHQDEEMVLARRGYPRSTVNIEAYEGGYEYGLEEGSKDAELIIRDLWRKVRKRKWLILSIALIVTTITTVEMYRRKSVYMASTMIEIAKEEYVPVKPSDVVFQDPDSSATPGALKTKMYIIQSDPLLEEVVLKLGLNKNPDFWSSQKEICFRCNQYDHR